MADFVETLVGLTLVVLAVVAVIGFIFLCEPSSDYAVVYNTSIGVCLHRQCAEEIAYSL